MPSSNLARLQIVSTPTSTTDTESKSAPSATVVVPSMLPPSPRVTELVRVYVKQDTPPMSSSRDSSIDNPKRPQIRFRRPFQGRLLALKTLDAISRQKARLRREMDYCPSTRTERRIERDTRFLLVVQERVETKLLRERVTDEMFHTRYLHRRIPWEQIAEEKNRD